MNLNVDWPLLRRQKQTLIQLQELAKSVFVTHGSMTHRKYKAINQDVEGLLSLLDSLQDSYGPAVDPKNKRTNPISNHEHTSTRPRSRRRLSPR